MPTRTPAVAALVAGIGIVFVLQFMLSRHAVGSTPFSSFPGDVTLAAGSLGHKAVLQNGEYWRLFTCIFLHGGLMHFIFNAYALVSLGRICEEIFGSWRMVMAFLVTGLAGSGASLLREVSSGGGTSVGASGAICGLLGLLIAHLQGRDDAASQMVRTSLVRWAVFIAIYSLVPSIDWAGHAGGFIAGYGLGRVLPGGHLLHLHKGWRRWWSTAVGGGLAVAAALCLVIDGAGALRRYQTYQAGAEILDSASSLVRTDDPQRTARTLSLSIPNLDAPPALVPAKDALERAMKEAASRPGASRIMAGKVQLMAWRVLYDTFPDMYNPPPDRER